MKPLRRSKLWKGWSLFHQRTSLARTQLYTSILENKYGIPTACSQWRIIAWGVTKMKLIVKSTIQDTIHSAQRFNALRLASPTYHTREDLQRDPYRPEEWWKDSITFKKNKRHCHRERRMHGFPRSVKKLVCFEHGSIEYRLEPDLGPC